MYAKLISGWTTVRACIHAREANSFHSNFGGYFRILQEILAFKNSKKAAEFLQDFDEIDFLAGPKVCPGKTD